jgi:hypothetical protein
MPKRRTQVELMDAVKPRPRVPDMRFDFYLADIGYEVDVQVKGQPFGHECRDFGGTHPSISGLAESLLEHLFRAINDWRGKL